MVGNQMSTSLNVCHVFVQDSSLEERIAAGKTVLCAEGYLLASFPSRIHDTWRLGTRVYTGGTRCTARNTKSLCILDVIEAFRSQMARRSLRYVLTALHAH